MYIPKPMNSTISKWGNSLGIRIPKHLADQLNLHEGSQVAIAVSDSALIVKLCPRKKYTLEELLSGMTPEHFHSEVATSDPVGNEFN
jgi:antitoxin MazE